MQLLKKLWSDESGFVLSAEAVLIGTLGVMGATVGLHTVTTAVNEELSDLGFAIRSLNQSYSVSGYRSCSAWKSGSSYIQEDVDISLRELCSLTIAEEPTTKDLRQHIEKINKSKLGPVKKNESKNPKKPAKGKSGEAAAEGDGKIVFPYNPT